jgi:surface protein
MTHHLWPEPRPGLRRILNVYTPLTDDTIKAAAQRWVTDDPDAKYGDVDTWDVSQVTSLENVWCGYGEVCGQEYKAMWKFNGDLSTWNVANVINMVSTFASAESFNGDISDWDVGKVTDMSESKSRRIFENDLT